MQTNPYINRKIRVMISIAATFVILFHGRWADISIAFTAPSFYIAFSVSFSICFLMVSIIHRGSLRLDKRFEWKRHLVRRTLLQLAVGVLLPIALDLLLIGIYFAFQGRGLVDSGFLLVDFPIIVAFVLLLNIYYMVHYMLRESGWLTNGSSNPDDGDRLTVDYNGYYASLDIAGDIFCLHRTGRLVTVVTVSGQSYPLKHSLGTLEDRFTQHNFYRINRSVIVNSQVIEGFQRNHKRNTFQLIFKAQYTNVVKDLPEELFWVRSEYKSLFTSHFKNESK